MSYFFLQRRGSVKSGMSLKVAKVKQRIAIGLVNGWVTQALEQGRNWVVAAHAGYQLRTTMVSEVS